MEHNWTRIEGMLIGQQIDPTAVARELRERGILAQLEWFPSTPQLLGLNLAVADGAVALVPADSSDVVAGPTPDELAEELAILFEAEVRIGGAAADHLPEGESPLAETWPEDDELDDEDESPSRIVEIGRTPASSVPLLAALEGVDLGDLELADDHRALLAELPPEKAGWNFGELPLVTLSLTDGEFQVFLVTDDHLEHVVTHNWAMDSLVVAGGHENSDDVAAEVIDLVGDRGDLTAIAKAIPGADIQALHASASLSGEEAVWKVVKALGLPAGVAGFLVGSSQMDEVDGVTVHLARGISNAIGRSVDIMLKEPESTVQTLWNGYQEVAVEKPWIIRIAAAVEATVGAGLLAACVRAAKPRSGWRIFSGVLGAVLVVDSVAEISLAKYVAMRHERKTKHDNEF
ncbi:hypothetical protein [Schaalia vaccimaxillae]|uniref:hypothetical protein n=1 Tax=Schaalia vaccimaxillae TaxID=183916 RepID=UPI0003B3E4FD|nr:hypothetical protein [Schaalia vaccimaxillae]